MIGSNRSFGYDAAATFANFIATPSIWDAFAVRSVIPTIPATNAATDDHLLLSWVSHLIYSATGRRSEVVYRLIPALAAGATVGVSTSVLTRRFGVLAGVCAGLYIATDPLFVDNSRDLRGYSLAALGSVVATLLLPVQGDGEAGRRGRLVAYAVIMGLAISAQLFAGVVLLLHIAWILTRRSRHDVLQLAPAWIAALVIGVTANATIQVTELTQHGLPPQMFNPTFPSDTIFFLLGAPVLLPLGLWLSSAGLGLWLERCPGGLWSSLAALGGRPGAARPGGAAVPATQDASGVLPGCRSREVSGRCRHTCPEASSGGPGRRAHACGRSASRRPPRRCPREGSPSGAPRAPFGGAPSK